VFLTLSPILLLLIPLTRILARAAKTNIDFSNVGCRMPIILLSLQISNKTCALS
jgi:hypothetical protein